MERKIILGNIIKIKADALIYSTNIDLRLSGGVGSALQYYKPRGKIRSGKIKCCKGDFLSEVKKLTQPGEAMAPPITGTAQVGPLRV